MCGSKFLIVVQADGKTLASTLPNEREGMPVLYPASAKASSDVPVRPFTCHCPFAVLTPASDGLAAHHSMRIGMVWLPPFGPFWSSYEGQYVLR